jgi:hypothetical protein
MRPDPGMTGWDRTRDQGSGQALSYAFQHLVTPGENPESMHPSSTVTPGEDPGSISNG